jgi:hypothetical protein
MTSRSTGTGSGDSEKATRRKKAVKWDLQAYLKDIEVSSCHLPPHAHERGRLSVPMPPRQALGSLPPDSHPHHRRLLSSMCCSTTRPRSCTSWGTAWAASAACYCSRPTRASAARYAPSPRWPRPCTTSTGAARLQAPSPHTQCIRTKIHLDVVPYTDHLGVAHHGVRWITRWIGP